MCDGLVVGAGDAGSVMAERLARGCGRRVLDRRVAEVAPLALPEASRRDQSSASGAPVSRSYASR